MSNHKNALKTAWNDITGDTIKTGKGSLDKYASGWDAIFGKRATPMCELEFYVEGQAADGSPYGPIFVVETDDEGNVVEGSEGESVE